MTFIDINSLVTSSSLTVLQPHLHVATFDTLIISSGFALTSGDDFL